MTVTTFDERGGGPRVLIDPQIYDLLNMGGAAMVLGLIARLRARWPDARLRILTESPDALAALVPDAEPVPYAHIRRWASDRYLLRPLFRVLPDRWAPAVIERQRRTERRFPALVDALRSARVALDPACASDYQALARVIADTDLLVVSGGSGPCDAFPATLRATVALLDAAARRGVPIAMVSQGAGDVSREPGRRMLRATLPGVAQLLVRERVRAPVSYAEWGVAAERIAWGGDDAIPLAYAVRPPVAGTALGINLRVAGYTGVGGDQVEAVGRALREFARARGAPTLGLPIAVHSRSPDHEVIQSMLAPLGASEADVGGGVRHPSEVIERAGRCRLVVTGAYHAAVFALSQGVPVIAVSGGALYDAKFEGLAAEFGVGCAIVSVEGEGFEARLSAALAAQWDRAPELRDGLLARAAALCDANEAAYERVFALLRPAARARAVAGTAR